jgi:hypothetical protein
MAIDIDLLFNSETVQQFLDTALGQHALYIEGSAAKFDEVVSWAVLNRMLAYGGLEHPRLRLELGGDEIAPQRYLRQRSNGYRRPLVGELTELLRQGAILGIEAAEDLHEPISEVCQTLEALLGPPVRADLYASGNDGPNRDLQWNDHETLLCQVSGRKEWSLFQPTTYYPVEKTSQPTPTGAVRWRGALLPGDMLYIPRGWWYCDRTLGVPALYLALTFRSARGIDVAWRVLRRADERKLMRADIPRCLNVDAFSAYLTSLQAELIELATEPGLVLNTVRDLRQAHDPRVEFHLPWTAAANPLPPSDEYVLIPLLRVLEEEMWKHPRPDGKCHIAFNGRVLGLDQEMATLLGHIWGPPLLTVSELLGSSDHGLPTDRVLRYLSEMIKIGIVTARATR